MRFQVKSDFTGFPKHPSYTLININNTKPKKPPEVDKNNLFMIIIYGGHPVGTGAVADGMWYNHGGPEGGCHLHEDNFA